RKHRANHHLALSAPRAAQRRAAKAKLLAPQFCQPQRVSGRRLLAPQAARIAAIDLISRLAGPTQSEPLSDRAGQYRAACDSQAGLAELFSSTPEGFSNYAICSRPFARPTPFVRARPIPDRARP